MEEILAALAAQQAELSGLITGRDEADWHRPSRCEGWSVADVVAHVAQTNELAIASAGGRLEDGALQLGWSIDRDESTVDAAAEVAVAGDRGTPPAELLARWQASADGMHAALSACDPSQRLPWVAGPLSAQTLATTRLSEAWIHTDDVGHAFGIAPRHTDRLRFIARLAWRTLPYAFGRDGRAPLAGPVRLALRVPDGSVWQFTPDEPAMTTIEGDALEWCLVAGRRLDPSKTTLTGTGPDVAAVLELVRTYA